MPSNSALVTDTCAAALRAFFSAAHGMSPRDSQLTDSRAKCAAWAA